MGEAFLNFLVGLGLRFRFCFCVFFMFTILRVLFVLA